MSRVSDEKLGTIIDGMIKFPVQTEWNAQVRTSLQELQAYRRVIPQVRERLVEWNNRPSLSARPVIKSEIRPLIDLLDQLEGK